MADYRLTNLAELDLVDIADYGFQKYGMDQALKYGAALEGGFKYLAENPETCRLREEFDPPVRIYPIGVHIVIYRIIDRGFIEITRIRHGREDWLPEG